uniref:Uncharacterized protein n=1 Tax=Tanacetum cinerariifolium TaxID=118510 RepID=A0A699HAU6_TANCI|nr:hypothetical protein [Tanacetum cinerariifolium]
MQVGTIPQAKKRPIFVGQHHGLSDLSGFQNMQNAMNQERRVVHLRMYVQSPYTNLLDTTVAPKKRPDKSKNMVRNAKVPDFDLGNAIVDDNLADDEVTIMGARDTDECIWYTNVDPNKVRRERYEECMIFLNKPHPIFWTVMLRVTVLWKCSSEN